MRTLMTSATVLSAVAAGALLATGALAQTAAGQAARAGEAAGAGVAGAAPGAAGTAAGPSGQVTAPSLTGSLGSLPPPPALTIDEQPVLVAPPAASACRMSCDLSLEDCLSGRGAEYWRVTSPEGYTRLSVAPEDAAQCGALQCAEQC